MQPSRALMTAALLWAGVSNVMAASSVDLSVVGKITPAACTPTLSNGGVVDHGKISAQDLHSSLETDLPNASLQVSVICDAPTLMAIKSADNRPGTATDPGYESASVFGLGLASNNAKIGRYFLRMAEVSADDVPGIPIESANGGTWLDASGDTAWQPGFMRTIKDPGNSIPTPLAMTTFKGVLEVVGKLNHKRNLPITEEIQIDGSATLDVIYL
ncbi:MULTISPECIES: DUF1120 domain-containing protein [Pseudomonas]|uniref:Protein GltF n=2 Tax=Pseudomonas TaxID=286 RepID=A0A0D0TFB2_PSEFL|nr:MULTISPECIES: DUF1120 domain-containing protein [Pseudomonas fluorescens group]AZE59473.1 Beta-fimbriae probable major subunit [Pseudomonas synxantha]KIR22141.1 hypothetical protein PFLU3_23560 [Pseudomonas fluorescens]